MACSKALLDKGKWIGEIGKYFDQKTVEQIARETKFVQRASKLSAMDFYFLCVFAHQKDEHISLSGLSAEILKEGKRISKQSLQERFNDYSSAFMEGMANEILQDKIGSPPVIIHPEFKRIIISDSTIFQLPCFFAGKYRGSGGGSSSAAVKIQYSYDLLSQKIIVMLVKQGIVPDSKQELPVVKKTTCM